MFVSSQHKTKVLSSNQAKVKSARKKANRGMTGFRSKGELKEAVDVTLLSAPDGLHGYSVDDLCIDPTCLSIVYVYNGVPILCLWSFKDKHWTKFR